MTSVHRMISRAVVALLLATVMIASGDTATASYPTQSGDESCRRPDGGLSKQEIDALNQEFRVLEARILNHNAEPRDFGPGQQAPFQAYNARADALNAELRGLRERATRQVAIPSDVTAQTCDRLLTPEENLTRPSLTPGPNNVPRGSPIGLGSSREEQRSNMRENESARELARKGYDVEQLRELNIDGRPSPDFRIEGRIFENKAPRTIDVDTIRDTISREVKRRKSYRFVLNLNDSQLTTEQIQAVFYRKPIAGLNEILVVRNGQVTRILPQ